MSLREPSYADTVETLAQKGSKNLRPLRHLFGYIARYKSKVFFALIALTIAAMTVLTMGSGLRYLIDQGFEKGDPALLDRAVIVLIGVVLILAASSYARFFLVSWIGERVVADIRRDVFDHVLTLSPGFFETTRTGEILSRISTDTTLVQVVVGSSVSIALRNALLLIGGTVMLLITSAKLTGFVFLVVPLVVAPIIFLGRRVRKLSRTTQDKIADVGVYVEETLNGIRAVQAFVHEKVDSALFAGRVEDAFTTAISRVRTRAQLTAIVITLVFGAIATVLWVGGRDVLSGAISAGELSAFVFYAAVVAGSVGALSEVIGDLQRAAGATERLIALLATESDIVPPAKPVQLPVAKGEVDFQNVAFNYPSRPDLPALKEFSLPIKAGETVALVGPSGAGKSTVFQLLLRFYDPQSGSVLVDGVDVRDADPKDVRARIGIVPQDAIIFSTSAAENIRYGRPEASDDEVGEAAKSANALEFIEKLPEGMDTYLGEKGVMLSGGQRQRIAIARAILKNPPILLLDEATSALDAESEKLVQDALDKNMVGRTTLIIAHRLATVLKADRIVVIDDGRLIASGSHQELLKSNDLYARLAELQFDRATEAAEAAQ